MELLTLGVLFGMAKTGLDYLVDQEKVGKIVSTVAGEVMGGRVDALLCLVCGKGKDYFAGLRTTDAHLNHDLERATRRAYLLATQEMVRQAKIRLEVTPGGGIWHDAVQKIRIGVETDLKDEGDTLPQRVRDVELWLLDEEKQPRERLRRLREALEGNLRADIEQRWLKGEMPPVIENLLGTGWRIDTEQFKNVDRNWHSLIAIAFMEQLKSNSRLAAIFQSKILAGLAEGEPGLQAVATFEGFQWEVEKVLVPLQRIEGSLASLHGKVDRMAAGVEEVKGELGRLTGMLGPLARMPRFAHVGLAVVAMGGLAALMWETASNLGCGVPMIRPWMELWERDERPLPMVVGIGLAPFGTEELARKDAMERAPAEAGEVCQGYSRGAYRLESAKPTAREWRCVKRAGGVSCGFEGQALCKVLVNKGRCQ